MEGMYAEQIAAWQGLYEALLEARIKDAERFVNTNIFMALLPGAVAHNWNEFVSYITQQRQEFDDAHLKIEALHTAWGDPTLFVVSRLTATLSVGNITADSLHIVQFGNATEGGKIATIRVLEAHKP